MTSIRKIATATLICCLLAGGSEQVMAQDASNPQTARSTDSSDWGLLGLIGLIGLLGLRRKEREP